MNSRILAAGLLVAGCVTAAAGGGYFAVRQNTWETPAPVAAAPEAPAARPVSETEAVIGLPAPAEATPEKPAAAPQPAPASAKPTAEPRRRRPDVAAARDREPAPSAWPSPTATAPPPAAGLPPTDPVQEIRVPEVPPPPPEPQFEELVIPASSVIGLQVETPLSSERSRVEDRVEARVTRDVTAAGRIAIPAGSRVVGAVSLVERGGKMKERARLGVRFHTLVLAGGREVPLRSEAIYREGDSPSSESARKIGGAAAGGAILGAILGGGKGAAIGGAAGAGAGSAAVMAGDRNAATLPAGTVVNVRLSAPTTIEVEKR
jgi:type F conjugative transfer system protein TrbI